MKARRNLKMNATSEILERIYKNSSEHKDGIYTRLYRYLLREDIYMQAYKNLYANSGAATKSVDEDTADGFSIEYVKSLINELKNQTYKPKAVRRIGIPKPNGKIRPLGIPSFRDKLLQDAIRQILESIYEPIFSDKSHGFRSKRSCHTALSQISRNFRSVKWFIEGDIKGCFDNIDHKILLRILSKKIKDSKFVTLIGKFLKAGYMEDWKYHGTYSGTPQGGILSPILANIYLNELDKKVEELKKAFDKKAKRAYSKPYCEKSTEIQSIERKIQNTNSYQKKQNLIKKVHKLKVERRKLPYKDTTDKKLSYVRYADDFIVGISGTKEEAEKIKHELKEFISKNLNLELSEEKTKITHSSENVRFLGYDINVRRNNKSKRKANGTIQRTLNNSVELLIPFEKIEKFMFDRKIIKQKPDGTIIPWQRLSMSGLSDLEIIDTFNSQTRGICNYYSLASNFGKLNYFTYLMEYSCLKTLAHIHKCRISHIKKKFQFGKSWGVPYETKAGQKRMMIVKYSNLSKKTAYTNDVDKIQNHVHYNNANSLEKRLRANKCEMCGRDDNIASYEIHHINKLKNLKGKEQWEKAMIARKRKTLVVCKECHKKIHHSS